MRDLDATQNELAALDQPVKIKTDPRSKSRICHRFFPLRALPRLPKK